MNNATNNRQYHVLEAIFQHTNALNPNPKVTVTLHGTPYKKHEALSRGFRSQLIFTGCCVCLLYAESSGHSDFPTDETHSSKKNFVSYNNERCLKKEGRK